MVLFLELDAGLDASAKAAALSILESFIFRRVLVGAETKEYNQLFVEIIGSIRTLQGTPLLEALEAKLLIGGGSTRRWPTDDEVIESVITRAAFIEIRKPALRLILERLEIYLRTKKSEGMEVPANLQIEHVLPQKWAKEWLLQGSEIPAKLVEHPFLAKDEMAQLADPIRKRNHALHTFGNLTLLNEYLNPAASNGSFAMKLTEYRHSVLRLNRHFDSTTGWDEIAISERGKSLGEAMCKLWTRPKS